VVEIESAPAYHPRNSGGTKMRIKLAVAVAILALASASAAIAQSQPIKVEVAIATDNTVTREFVDRLSGSLTRPTLAANDAVLFLVLE
jgi:hypothetical protein